MQSTKENLQVLFEDNHLLIVNKRAGDITQGDKTGDKPLNEVVKEYVKEKYQKPGKVFIGTVHRLDRPTSGIVILARTSKALERLNKMLRICIDLGILGRGWSILRTVPSSTPVRARWF